MKNYSIKTIYNQLHNNPRPRELNTIYLAFILAIIIFTPLFIHLDKLVLRQWDEARLAVNASEMLENRDYVVTHFEGKPDMWSTKPPLMIWTQVICMKLLGVNEVSVRLPSAIAAFLTCMALFLFFAEYIKLPWLGFCVSLVLATANGYVDTHASRTGDYDVPLALFTTIGTLFYFLYIETSRNKFLYLFFLCFSCAVLTKGVAGLLFIPALFIYTIWQKKLITLIKNKHAYTGFLIFLSLTLCYYIVRELENPGYIETVWINEIGGRYTAVVEEHSGDFLFYYTHCVQEGFPFWVFFVPGGILIGLLNVNKRIKRLSILSFIVILSFFLIISSSQTKIAWYDIPMYPFLSIFVAILLYFFFQMLRDVLPVRKYLFFNIIPYIFLFLVFIIPYRQMINKTFHPREEWVNDDSEISYFLREVIKGKQECNNYYVLCNHYAANIDFYIKILQNKGMHVSRKSYQDFASGDKIVVYRDAVDEFISKYYLFEKTEEINNIVKLKINGIK